MPRSWRLAGGRGPGVPLAVGPSPSITGVPTQDFSRKRARRNTPAEHHPYKLSPHCTPPLEPCERGKKGRPQAAACSLPLSNGTRLPSNKAPAAVPVWGCRVPEKNKRFGRRQGCLHVLTAPLHPWGKAPQEKAFAFTEIIWRYARGRKKN